MDIWTKEKRSDVMSKIRGKNTKPEMILRSQLFRQGFRFRVHQKDLPGKPDIVFPKYKTVIFVHGCFWHFHNNCREGRIPSTNSKYWDQKLTKNKIRDQENIKSLRKNNWRVIVVWECQIEKNINKTMMNVMRKLVN
ncbi:MAG: DNA mismatch endonuclease Vsr [Ignavibacteria bacterium]|nr:DNA mismatch endonuclease Vsr [Ignavibacteria bacterium]